MLTGVTLAGESLANTGTSAYAPPVQDTVSHLIANADGSAPLERHERLLTEAGAREETEPTGCVRLLIEASSAALQGGEMLDATAAAERALSLAADTAPAYVSSARFALASALLIRGRRAEARSLLDGLSELDEEALGDDADRAVTLLFWSEEYEAARELLERVVDAGRRANRPDRIARPLDTLASVDFRGGHWRRAQARSREALRLARLSGNPFDIGSALTTQARIAAARGDETSCRRLLEEARGFAVGDDLVGTYAATAQALLELSLDRPEAAIAHLEPLCGRVLSMNEPNIFQWEPDLIEAYVRTGQCKEAESLLRDFEERASASRRAWGLAAASRCRGLLGPSEEAEQHLLLALRRHDDVPMPFERARTELCLGERLRRMRRARDARIHLHAALATFERLGATPWAARARRELLTRTSSKPAASRIEELLTPHELEVAALVARGVTNREAAAALFVSPKTIEYHLSSIYRKLGVRSRTELAGIVAGLRL
jgi:DNA-binding CsgD family transcriptional regulator